MKNLRPFAVVTCLLFLCITAAGAPDDRWLHDAAGYARALELQRERNVPLVVYFYADWCPYCHRLENDYFPAAPVQQYLRSVVKVRINPEHGPAERDLADRYRIRGYPAFFVMSTSGSAPRNVHPFRRGANLTPAEFVSACQQAASLTAPEPRSTRAPSATTVNRQVKSQLVEVPRSSSPTFINNAPLPTLDTVLANYVAAIGGREAQKRITSRVSKGRVDVPGVSFGGKVEVYAKAPNKSLTMMNVEPVGLVKQGFDGRVAWGNTLDVANGVERAALVDVDFYREVKLSELYTRVKLLGKVKEGFREVYLVEAVTRSGAAESLYFDVESGLLVRRDLPSKNSVRTEIYFSDWRDLDGVKLPFKITQVLPNRRFVITLEDVKHNVPVDDTIFRRP